MTIRARRRVEQGSTLEEMNDQDLESVYFFNTVSVGGVVTYQAVGEEWRRAGEILRKRGVLKGMSDESGEVA